MSTRNVIMCLKDTSKYNGQNTSYEIFVFMWKAMIVSLVTLRLKFTKFR